MVTSVMFSEPAMLVTTRAGDTSWMRPTPPGVRSSDPRAVTIRVWVGPGFAVTTTAPVVQAWPKTLTSIPRIDSVSAKPPAIPTTDIGTVRKAKGGGPNRPARAAPVRGALPPKPPWIPPPAEKVAGPIPAGPSARNSTIGKTGKMTDGGGVGFGLVIGTTTLPRMPPEVSRTVLGVETPSPSPVRVAWMVSLKSRVRVPVKGRAEAPEAISRAAQAQRKRIGTSRHPPRSAYSQRPSGLHRKVAGIGTS